MKAAKEWQQHRVTAAHNCIWRHQYYNMHAAQKLKSKLKFVKIEKKISNMSTPFETRLN
jgi:hypothetical protein